MTEQQIKDGIRGFLKAVTDGDTKTALSLLSDDAVWVAPQGTFKGKSEIEKLIVWGNKVNKDNKVTEIGIGIIAQGDTGVIEHKLSGIYSGKTWEVPAVCIYEFKNNKIANMRGFYDQLSIAEQAVKGMFAKWAVNMVVNATRKGLK